MPDAIVASDRSRGVRSVIDAIVVVVASAHRARRAVVVLDLAVVGTGSGVVRVGEVGVTEVEARVAEGHELTRAVDAVIVDRGREVDRVAALDDPSSDVIRNGRLYESIDVHESGCARVQREGALVELDPHGSRLPEAENRLSATEVGHDAENLRQSGRLERGDFKRDS